MPEALCAARVCVSPERIEHDAALIIEKGRVLDVLPRSALGRPDFPVCELGARTIVPAPVNCHAHLELSHLQGRTRLGQGFTPWVQSLLQQDMTLEPQALDMAVEQLAARGTAHVADVCSRAPLAVAQALEAVGVGYTLCAETFGHAPLPEGATPLPQSFLQVPESVMRHVAGAGHALYSTSPERLQRARFWSREQGRPFFLHLAEHREEVELLTRGQGDLAELLRKRILPRGWRPPGLRPVAWAQALGLLGPETLAVHCVQLDDEDISILAESGASVCLCPRSNAAINVGEAPVARLLEAGVPCCLGTDSLASNNDLDIWSELRYILPRLQAGKSGLARIVELTSGNGARVLRQPELGSLAPGKAARWALLPQDLEA